MLTLRGQGPHLNHSCSGHSAHSHVTGTTPETGPVTQMLNSGPFTEMTTTLKESTGVTLSLHLNLRALSHLETAHALKGRQVQALLRISTPSCHLNGLLPSGVPKLSTRPFFPASLLSFLLSFPSSPPPWQVFFYADIL